MYSEPITTVDYEESTQQITTELETHVVIRDPGMTTVGYGMLMQLRKNNPTAAGTRRRVLKEWRSLFCSRTSK